MKKVIILIAVIGAAALAWTRLGPEVRAEGSDAGLADAVFEARRGDLKITVTENGYLKAKNSTELKPEFQRRGTITWLVEEGSEVEEGETLVEFDKSELEDQLEDARSSLIQYQTELEAAQAELTIQKRENESSVEKAELALEIAELNLEKYEEGEAPNERRKLVLATEKATSEYERADERFREAPRLEKEGFLTKIQVEEERIRLRETEIGKENAEKDLFLYEKYTHPIQLKQKKAEVKDARLALENAQEKSEISLKERQARVARHERQVTSAEQQIEKYEKDLEAMTMRAPTAGVVHYGDPKRPWTHDQVKVGNDVYHGNTVITLPDLTEMQVLVSIHEADIDQLEEGQDVSITLDSMKGRSFHGAVTKIDSVATSDWSDSSNRTFGVEIDMTNLEGEELRAGISATVEIQIDELSDVLHVPIHAVFAEEGEHFVFVKKDSEPRRRSVTAGKNNSHYVEVIEGLEEGEAVLLFDPRITGSVGGGGEDEAEEEPPSGPPNPAVPASSPE